MQKLKRYFVMPYLASLFAIVVHSVVGLVVDGVNQLAWLGALLATAPMLGFMLSLVLSGKGRTARRLWLQHAAAWLGLTVTIVQGEVVPLVYAGLFGVFGVLVYDFWYSSLYRTPGSALVVGEKLPEFPLTDSTDEEILSTSFAGSPVIFMFVRGNWCPLCMAQIHEIAGQYRDLHKRGVTVVLVSAQSLKDTRTLAKKFDVPIRFCSDIEHRAARKLGIEHISGVPFGITGYEADTLLPTVLIVDAQQRIIYADQTDNYRVRPEPELFFRVLDEAGIKECADPVLS